MNIELAKRIKQLYIYQSFSWKEVGQIIAREYPGLDLDKVISQRIGMQLCDNAMKILKEEWKR